MVVIKEFIPRQKENVFKYVEKKCREREIEKKFNCINALLDEQELLTVQKGIENFVQKNKVPSKPSFDLEEFLQETNRHLNEARLLGYQINSLHDAVKNLSKIKSSELMERRIKAGECYTEDVTEIVYEPEKSTSLPAISEIERYANGTIKNQLGLIQKRLNSPVSIKLHEEFVLHNRISLNEFEDIHLKNVKKTVSKTQSLPDTEMVPEKRLTAKMSNDALNKNKLRKKFVSECPPKVKQMLQDIRERRKSDVTKRIVVPVSVLNLSLS